MDLQGIFNSYVAFIQGVFFKTSSRAVVGIDIGTSSVKAVEISFEKKLPELKAWAVEAIERQDAKAALERLLKRMNIKEQASVASVSGKGTLIRYIEMPRMSLPEVRKSFAYEIDKHFPFDPKTIYTDCYIVDPQGKEKKMTVLVVAAKKDMVDERVKTFKEIGLDLASVTNNAIATANAFESLVKSQNTSGAKAILDIGGSVSSLMILDKVGAPSFTRDIYIGSQDVTKQIANNLGIDLAQAEILKCEPKERAQEVAQAFEAALDNLINEVHLSFDYFSTEKNIAVKEMYLLGGGSLLKGIESSFEKMLHVSVKVWDPLVGLTLGQQVNKAEIEPFSSQLGVAAGLAMTRI